MMSLQLTLGLFLAATAAPVTGTNAADAGSRASADTATVSYEVAGLRVIHRPLAANDIVAVNLYLLGGSRQLTDSTAGIEAMLLRVSEYGTAAYPGRSTRLAIGRTGSRTVLEAEPDWTMFGFRGVVSGFDSTWAVFADRIVAPSLDSTAVEIVRRRMLRAARSRRNHPDAMLQLLADSVAFRDHPYRFDPEGSERALTAIDRQALRTYHEREMVTSRMLLVVVGNVSRERIESAVQHTFGRLPRGEYSWSLPAPWAATRASVTTHERRLPTNYLLGYFAGPPADSRDYLAFRIATTLLGGYAAHHIRENGLSYAAYSPFLERGASGAGFYVTTTRPDTAIRIFNNAVELLRSGSPPRAWLQRYFDGFMTSYYSENESNAGQAEFLARYQLLHGDWRTSARYMSELKSIQGFHLRAAVGKYVRNIQYVYLGNPAFVPERELTRY